MKHAIEKYLQYLQSVRNSSPHTILNYGKDLEQFIAYLSPPGEHPPALPKITHLIIREFVGHLHEQGLEKSSIARKLAALRSFFKYCAREGMIKENPARLVPTPKLPKRIPSVLSAEDMSEFLEGLAGAGLAATGGRPPARKADDGSARGKKVAGGDGLLLRRDRALVPLDQVDVARRDSEAFGDLGLRQPQLLADPPEAGADKQFLSGIRRHDLVLVRPHFQRSRAACLEFYTRMGSPNAVL